MGASKSDLFTERQNQLANLAKALSHPARIAILEHLLSAKACICGDLVDVLPLAQPTVSQHLKEMKSAGLIRGNVEGTSICYCVEDAALEPLNAFLTHLSTELTHQKISCC